MLERSSNSMYPLSTILEKHKPKKLDLKQPADRVKFEKICKDPNWTGEEKRDGVSAFAIGARLFTIRKSSVTGYPTEKTEVVPHIAKVLRQYGESLVLDGELFKFGEKSYDICSIINSEISIALSKQEERGPVLYVVYDMLQLPSGEVIADLPFEQRRSHLESWYETLTEEDKKVVILNENFPLKDFDVEAILNEILARGGEGLVLKNKKFRYHPGSRAGSDMIKLKANFDDDVVIMGFNDPKRTFTGKTPIYFENGEPVSKFYALGLIGSIRVGKYNKEGQLVQIGSVSGISDSVREHMTKHPEEYIGKVCRIKAMEPTNTGANRHANYKGLHEDKNPTDCIIEE